MTPPELNDIIRIGLRERQYVNEVLSQQFRTSSGASFMRRFEESFADYYGSKYAISMVNGTATLHALLEAAGIGVGDEVIIPPLTMSATAFAVIQAGATPVFADIDPDTYQADARAIEDQITSRTKAIITVALYGLSPDMDPIMEIAQRSGAIVIEDNAECFRGEYHGRLVGRLGHAASFSFQSSKHLTSGEGGIVITDNPELAEGVRRVGSLGYAGVGASRAKISKRDIQDPNYDRHVAMGWNYRMPELCCAVALAQVERIDELVDRRVAVARLFHSIIEGRTHIRAQKTPPGLVHSYWSFVAEIQCPNLRFEEFRDLFASQGGDGIYAAWKLSYLEPMFRTKSLLGRERFISAERLSAYRQGLCPVAESVQPRLLQFRTNYWVWADALRQADALERTLDYLDSRFS